MHLPLSFNLRFHLFIRIVRYSHSISVPSIVNNQRHRIASKISPFDYHFHKSASINVGKKKEKITRANHILRMIKHARFATGAQYVRDGQTIGFLNLCGSLTQLFSKAGKSFIPRDTTTSSIGVFFAIQLLLQVVRWSQQKSTSFKLIYIQPLAIPSKNDRAGLKPVDRNEVIAKHLVRLRPAWPENVQKKTQSAIIDTDNYTAFACTIMDCNGFSTYCNIQYVISTTISQSTWLFINLVGTRLSSGCQFLQAAFN